METVKNSKDFECIMKAREARMERDYPNDDGWYHRRNTPIKCRLDGTPFNKRARRTVCEIEKLALGLKRAYMLCGKVEKLRVSQLAGNLPRMAKLQGIKDGDNYRMVYLYLDRDEYNEEVGFLDRFFAPVVFGEKLPDAATSLGGGWGTEGTACAYPGGCD